MLIGRRNHPASSGRHLSSVLEELYLDLRRPLFVLACFALTFMIFGAFARLHNIGPDQTAAPEPVSRIVGDTQENTR
jgi:hypothetical protein